MNHGNIREEDTFTLSATRHIRIKEIQSVCRLAIYKANNRQRVETYGWAYGDGHYHKKSRSFHIAITRPLNDEERFLIENCFKETCERAGWGNPDIFFVWGVHLRNEKGEHSDRYLEKHTQKHLVKMSPGKRVS